jgi:hypothetical protein
MTNKFYEASKIKIGNLTLYNPIVKPPIRLVSCCSCFPANMGVSTQNKTHADAGKLEF